MISDPGGMNEAGGPTDMTNKSVMKAMRLIRELAAHPRTGATVMALARIGRLADPRGLRVSGR